MDISQDSLTQQGVIESVKDNIISFNKTVISQSSEPQDYHKVRDASGIYYTVNNLICCYFQDISEAELAAVCLREIAANHFFGEGNKRTATLVANYFLELRGYELSLEDTDEMTEYMKQIAAKKRSLDDIAEIVRQSDAIRIYSSKMRRSTIKEAIRLELTRSKFETHKTWKDYEDMKETR